MALPPGRPAARRPPGEVVVRPLSSPKAGWTLEDAVRLAGQGYRLEHVHKVTGWHPAQVRATAAAADRTPRPSPDADHP